MKDLKSCPFCGNEVNIQSSSRSEAFIVSHTGLRNCPFFRFEMVWREVKTLDEARQMWNRRNGGE